MGQTLPDARGASHTAVGTGTRLVVSIKVDSNRMDAIGASACGGRLTDATNKGTKGNPGPTLADAAIMNG